MDRVLSLIVDLRCIFSLSFIPLEPYPARSARHLPHAGKALIWKYRFPHPTSAPSGHLLPQEGGSGHASPFPWKGLPSAARQGWLLFCGEAASSLPSTSGKEDRVSGARVLSYNGALETISPLSFIPLVPYPARSARHLPHAGKALSVGNTAFLTQPPPLRGTSFLRKEGVSTRALPLEGAAEHSEAGLASFFAAKPPPLCLPHWGRGTAPAALGCSRIMAHLRRSPRSLSYR